MTPEAGKVKTRSNVIVTIAVAVAVAMSVVIVVRSDVPLGVRSPTLHSALETAAACVALLAALHLSSLLAEFSAAEPSGLSGPLPPEPLPLVRPSDVALARARALYEDGHLREALRALERIAFNPFSTRSKPWRSAPSFSAGAATASRAARSRPASRAGRTGASRRATRPSGSPA